LTVQHSDCRWPRRYVRAGRYGVVLAVLIALSAPGSLAAAADEPAVVGTATAAGAPELPGGRYRDTLPDRGATKHYAITAAPGSALHVVAVVLPIEVNPEATNGFGANFRLFPQGRDPLQCRYEYGPGYVTPLGVTSVPTSIAVAVDRVGEGQRAGCEGTTFALALTREADHGPSPFADGPIPVEITVRIDPPADDRRLPREATTALPPVTVPDATEPVTPIGGGASPFSAPEIMPGVTYRDAVIGGIRYYKVRLQWGQRLGFRLRPNALGCALPKRPIMIYAGVLNSIHERLSDVGELGFVNPKPDILEGSMPWPVRYTHRLSADLHRPDYAFDGFHYLIVRSDQEVDAVPYDLVVAVDGSVEPGPVALGSLSGPADVAPTAAPAPALGCSGTAAGLVGPARVRAMLGGLLATLVVAGVAVAAVIARRGSGAQHFSRTS
jgi:Ca-activated chloride channel homolog